MNAPNTSGWKPGTPEAPSGATGIETVTGNRGLMLEEPLIFEIGGADTCGVDLPEPESSLNRLGGLARSELIGLPGLSEPSGKMPQSMA